MLYASIIQSTSKGLYSGMSGFPEGKFVKSYINSLNCPLNLKNNQITNEVHRFH